MAADEDGFRRVMEPLGHPMASRAPFLIAHDRRTTPYGPRGSTPALLDMPPSGGRAKVV
ncbi:MAG: hypothetical protein HOY79_37560 [Streptomyces sp.]|nr:hypothetical protein [Streptomyces sp.]